MDSLNLCALVGRIERPPTIRFDHASGTAQCSCTLRCDEVNASGSVFKLYVPLTAYGKTAEALGELQADALVAIQGRLGWRKQVAKRGEEKSGLAVFVRQVHMLMPALQEVQG